jgi:hypothetical protein
MPSFITHKPLDDISEVSSEFGLRIPPTPLASDSHSGIDFPAASNSNVYAANTGRVTSLSSNSAAGNYIIITSYDEDGEALGSTSYSHLNSYGQVRDQETEELRLIRVGDVVNAGTTIALSGNTGAASSGAHLHFVVRDSESVKINPRPLLAEAFPEEFSTIVPSGNFGVELQGDSRDNLMLGNDNPNIMSGQEGFDTYYVNFGDTISDVDANGRIVINNGEDSSVLLEGSAFPKKDTSNNIIPNSWSLNNYDLTRTGDNLVITEAGEDISNPETPRITIPNFDFDAPGMSFGFSLGKVSEVGDTIIQKVDLRAGNSVFPLSDKRGRFITFGSLPSVTSRGDSIHGILTYDSEANSVLNVDVIDRSVGDAPSELAWNLSLLSVHDFVSSKVSAILANGNIAYSYKKEEVRRNINTDVFLSEVISRKRSYKLIIVDREGKIVSNRLVLEGSYSRDGLPGDTLPAYTDIRITPNSSIGGPHIIFKDRRISTVDIFPFSAETGEIGEGIFNIPISDPNSDVLGVYNNPVYLQYVSNSIRLSDEMWPTSHRVSSFRRLTTENHETRYDVGFEIKMPRYRGMTANEIPNFQLVTPSQDFTTSGELNQIITFQNAVNEISGGTLQITPIPNARLFIRGMNGGENGQIDLSNFNLTPEQLAQATTEVSSSQYSMTDLLNGEYAPGARRVRKSPSMDELSRGRAGNSVIDEDTLETLERERRNTSAANESIVDDDYYNSTIPSQELIDRALADTPESFTIVTLPVNGTESMQLIFPGIGRAAFVAKIPEVIFDLVQSTLTSRSDEVTNTTEAADPETDPETEELLTFTNSTISEIPNSTFQSPTISQSPFSSAIPPAFSTTTSAGIGGGTMSGDTGLSQTEKGLAIAGGIAAAAAVAAGAYKLATDPKARESVRQGFNSILSISNPRKWGRVQNPTNTTPTQMEDGTGWTEVIGGRAVINPAYEEQSDSDQEDTTDVGSSFAEEQNSNGPRASIRREGRDKPATTQLQRGGSMVTRF